MDHLDLDSIDADGAIAETHAAAQEAIDSGHTRSSFLRKGALAGGAAMSGGAILGALLPGTALAAGGAGAPPVKPYGKGDIGILNYALTLEYLESSFYNAAAKNNVAKGDKQLTAFLKTAQTDENAHVKFLKAGLGSSAIKSPKFNFGKAVTDKATFAATAYALENTGVHAYLGQAGNISAAKYLLAAASIVTVEARHSGAIGLYLGMAIAPTPFDTGWTYNQVIKAVTATKFIVS
jgi:hypothetical protein